MGMIDTDKGYIKIITPEYLKSRNKTATAVLVLYGDDPFQGGALDLTKDQLLELKEAIDNALSH